MFKAIFFSEKFGRIVSWERPMVLRGCAQRGVSMIELLVVMAIIAMMLGWGGVHMVTHLSEYRLKAAVRDLISTMQKARRTAIRDDTEAAVFFDPTDESYSFCNGTGDGSWNTRNDNICPQIRFFPSYKSGIRYGHGIATTPVGSTFGTNNVSYQWGKVVFTSRGTAKHSGYVYIENDKGQTHAVGTITLGTILPKQWNATGWEHY